MMDILRNVGIAALAIIFLGAGLTFLTASVVVPAAARELEKECLELAPDLWREYQTKLEPGETIDQRPDLMQEVGQKLQPLLDAKLARSMGQGQNVAQSTTNVDRTDVIDTSDTVIDVSAVTTSKTEGDETND
mmetsp:Transcript_38330/g.89143  ORF Transcript_38330/g.89143 Transcript_38330/m.89143 type:complete len:133 (-) Transcript_38330:156-554(-)